VRCLDLESKASKGREGRVAQMSRTEDDGEKSFGQSSKVQYCVDT
jgi:hypothetical protein